MSRFYKNVVGYGTGLKVRNGKTTGQEAIVFFVEKKTSDVPKEDFIPKTINGKPTDVIATGRIKPMLLPPCSLGVRDLTIAPLRGGMTIGSETLSGIGTLGAIVKELATGKLVALTNAHVAGNPLNVYSQEVDLLDAAGYEYTYGGTAVGEKMYQGAKPDGNQFGEVVKDVAGSFNVYKKVDGAIVSIKSEYGVTPGIMGLTKYAQTFQHISTTHYGDTVYKSGRTTGTTKGYLASIDATVLVDVCCGLTKEYRDQILIYPENPGEAFSGPGDSGSVICTDRGNGYVSIVGLLHSGTADGSITVASAIDDVCHDLGIVPWSGEIVLSEDCPDVVSTAFGAIYTDDSATFLSVTNDHVCDGTVCGGASLSVMRASNSVVSNDMFGHPNLVVGYTNLSVSASCDTSVELAVTLKGISGAVAVNPVQISSGFTAVATVTSAANADRAVDVEARLSTATVVGTGIEASMDATVSIMAACDAGLGQALRATMAAQCSVLSRLEAAVAAGAGVQATCNSKCFVQATLSAGNAIGDGVPANVDSEVSVSASCITDISQVIPASASIPCRVKVALDSEPPVTRAVTGTGFGTMRIAATLDAPATATAVPYGGGSGSVGTCDAGNVDDLYFGVAL